MIKLLILILLFITTNINAADNLYDNSSAVSIINSQNQEMLSDNITLTDFSGSMSITIDKSLSNDITIIFDYMSQNPQIHFSKNPSKGYLTVQAISTNGKDSVYCHQNNMNEFISHGNIIYEKILDTMNVKGYLTLMERNVFDKKRIYLILDFVKNNKSYMVMAWTSEQYFNRYKPMFEKALHSFTVE